MTPLKIVMTIGAVLGVCSAIAATWVQLGGAIPASQLYVTQSGESIKKAIGNRIQKVESSDRYQTEESAKLGREIFKSKVRDILTSAPPADPQQRIWYEDRLDRAQEQEKFYEDLEIELRKK